MHKLLYNRLLMIISLLIILGLSMLCYSQAPDQPAKSEAPAQPAESEVIVSFTETNANTPITRDQAVKITRGLLGIEPQAHYTARSGLATDNTIPFLKVTDRLAWEIVFENLAVTFPGMEGPKPEFSTIICLLDAQTGALLKVSTKMPATGAVYTETLPGSLTLEKAMEYGKLGEIAGIPAAQLAQVTVKPLIPLLIELDKRDDETIRPAKQLVAYFVLYTDRARPSRNIVDRPFWIVMTGGLHRLMPKARFGTHYATDAQFFIDACSGKRYSLSLGENYK